MSSRVPFVMVCYFISILLELIGLSLIVPYIYVISDPQKLNDYTLWVAINETMQIENQLSLVFLLSALVVLVFLIKTILNVFLQFLVIRFSYDLQTTLHKRLSTAYINAHYLFHTKRRTNEIINVMQSHVNQFSKGVVGSILRISGEFLTLLIIGIYLLLNYPIPSLTAFFSITIFVGLFFLFVRKRLSHQGRKLISAGNELIKNTNQGLKGIKEIRVFGKSSFFVDQVVSSAVRTARSNKAIAFIQILPRYLLEFIFIIVVVATVIFNILIYDDTAQLSGELVVFAFAGIRLLPSASQLALNFNTLVASLPMMNEIFSDLKATESSTILQPKKSPETLNTVEFNDLEFSYPESQVPVVKHADIKISKGEVVGIFGPSGSGKSTLINIILGLLEPNKGTIKFNEKDLSFEQWQELEISSYIPQSPVMLDGTIISNVAFGHNQNEINEERVINAIKNASLEDVLKQNKMDIHSSVGEDAILLSGGQRQRVAIARSFYFDRSLIIFDEVTSALDKNTEKDVLEAIVSLKEKAGVLIISHSMQAIDYCDRVYQIHKGIIKET